MLLKQYYNFEHSILDIANDFHEAYKRCVKGESTHFDEYGRTVQNVVNVPAIVNGAFACELYIKSMLPSDDSWGHNLYELFYELPDNLQSLIKAEIECLVCHKDLTCECILNNLSEAFVFWRYIHEKPDFGKFGLNDTLKVLPILLFVFEKYAENK